MPPIFIMEYQVLSCVLLIFMVSSPTSSEDLSAEQSSGIPGHLQILGKHKPPEGHIEVLDTLPSPEEFWEKYAKNGVPVLFRGMANNSLGKERWTDAYLYENYSDLRVKIEAKAEKEKYPEGDRGVGQDTLKYFLDTYRTRNAYVVSQLPDPMSQEVSVPPFMTCGTFSQRLLEANLWFSSGGTKSLLHRDADDAINCLYFGTKDWIFIHPRYGDSIPIGIEETKGYGGFAVLDPDRIDLEQFPRFADVPWTYGNVTAGDCIFLPRGYWHQVRSYGSRNLAVSLLFSRINEAEFDDCQGATLSYKPLSEMEMVFTYDGYGEQTMGDTDPFELNETLKEWSLQSGCSLDRNELMNHLVQEYSKEEVEEMDPSAMFDADILLETASQLIEVLDNNRDGLVTCEEMQGLKLATLKKLANILGRDPANTEQYEYARFEPHEIRNLITDVIQKHKAAGQEHVSQQVFLDAYQELGGSRKIGSEMFSKLPPSDNGEAAVSVSELETHSEVIADLFKPKMKYEGKGGSWSYGGSEMETRDPRSVHSEL